MRKNLALIALAASGLFAGAAQAVPVEYNGGLFDFNASNCVGLTCTITYTADFTNFDAGGQTNIGGIQWTVSGNPVTSVSLLNTNVVGWADSALTGTSLSANGCSGGAAGAVCSQDTNPFATTTGSLWWSFTATFTNEIDAASFNATNTGNPIRMWFVDANGRNRGLMSCVTGNANGECGTAVPEPGTLALLGLGLLGIGAARRRRA